MCRPFFLPQNVLIVAKRGRHSSDEPFRRISEMDELLDERLFPRSGDEFWKPLLRIWFDASDLFLVEFMTTDVVKGAIVCNMH